MGILEWAAIFDTVGGLAKVVRRVGQGAVEGLAGTQPRRSATPGRWKPGSPASSWPR